MTAAIPLMVFPSGYSDIVDSGVASECDSLYNQSSFNNPGSGIHYHQEPIVQYDQFPRSDIDSNGGPASTLRLPTVVTIPVDNHPHGKRNPLLDNCYQRAIARAKERLLKGEILDKNGEWRIPGAPVPSRPDYSKVKPTKDKSKHRRRKTKHQRSETYPQGVLKDKNSYEHTASNVFESSGNRLTNTPCHSTSSRVPGIGADYVGRSYVQFTGTASLNPKYLSAVDVRTRNDDIPNMCYGCRSDVGGYGEGALVGLYDSIGLRDGQECHHNIDDGGSVNTEVTIKYDGDVTHGRSTMNSGRTYASQSKNVKPRRVGGGFLFYDTGTKSRNATSLPTWISLSAAETVSKETVLFHVDKLQEPDGPVYAPTIPRETRSPVPQFIRDRQLHGPDFAKPSLYETVMKYNMDRNKGSLNDGESSVTSGLGTSISSELLKRQKDEEEEEARLREREERKAREDEEKRKAEEYERRRKEESRKELYKAPKPFKLKPTDAKTTVSTDPFSKNRSYNIPEPKDIDIKKSSKPVTKPQEFQRRDSNWKEPKKFELKKDSPKKTTEFWEAPKRTGNSPVKPKGVALLSPPKEPSPLPEVVPEPVESDEEIILTPEPSPPVIEKDEVVSQRFPTPIPSTPEKKKEIEVQEPERETREPLPPQDPSPATSTASLPSIRSTPVSLRNESTPQKEQTPTPERDPAPDSPTKDSTPHPQRERTPPTPPRKPTPPPPKESTPPPPKEPTPKPPPLPEIEEVNPIIVKPIIKPEEKVLKLKRLQPPKTQKTIERPKKLPDLKSKAKLPKHEPKKTRKLANKVRIPMKRKQEMMFPKVQPKEPEQASPEPEPPPGQLVLPPLPSSPVIQPKEKTPPPSSPSPIPLPSPSAPKREPIIWMRKVRKMKQRWNRPKKTALPESPEPIVRDPLDYLAKYCIVQKNRIGFYERVFSQLSKGEVVHQYEEEEWNEGFSIEGVAQPSFITSTTTSHGGKDDAFRNTFGPSAAEASDAEEYISPTDITLGDAGNGKPTESPTSDLDSSIHSPRLDANDDLIQIQHRLDKLNFILDNVYTKIGKLHAQIYEYQEEHDASVKQLARTEFEREMRENAERRQNKTGNKNKKGKGMKSPKKDNDPSTVTVGASPRDTPRGSPSKMELVDTRHLTDDQIVARTSSATMRVIKNDPSIRKVKLAKTRANEKLDDMEKWLSELKEESSLMNAQVSEQKRREDMNRAAANIEFRRAQSGLYRKMNPLEEHEVQMSDMEPLLRQINGQLITKKECQYVYHVLNLPKRHKLNFKLFTVVAALSEKVSRLEPFVKKMINKMDFEALDVKMQRAKELFQLLEDECDETYPGEVTIDSLTVELHAGGLSKDNIQFVVNKFGREGNGIVDFLDYLTYLPLFIDIHGNIINDPLNRDLMNV